MAVLNLSSYVTDWDADNRQALVNAIQDIPAADNQWASTATAARYSGGHTIILDPPALDRADGKILKVAGTVELPGNKSICFQSEGPRGCRVEQLDHTPYTLRCLPGNRSVVFDSVVFWKGGVAFESGTKGYTGFHHCHFEATLEWGIVSNGQTVLDVNVNDTLFHDCQGGVSVDHPNCDLWRIDNCRFWRNRGVDIVVGSTGVIVDACDFEVRPVKSSNEPFIHVNGGGAEIRCCRFGNEVESPPMSRIRGAPPKDIIVIGPLAGPDQPPRSFQDILIADNRFLGNNRQPHSQSARHAIVLNRWPDRCRFYGNHFRKHNGALLQQNYEPNAAAREAVWLGNTVHQDHTAGVFSGTQNGFDVWPAVL